MGFLFIVRYGCISLCMLVSLAIQVQAGTIYDTIKQAEFQRLQGHHNQALQTLLQQKLDMEATQQGSAPPDPRLYALLINRLGDLYLQLNQWGKAAALLVESVGLARDTGDRPLLAANLNNYGNMVAMAGNDAYAQAAFAESMSLALEMNNENMYWQAAGNMLRLYWLSNKHAEVVRMLHNALSDLDAGKNPDDPAVATDLARLLHRIRHSMADEQQILQKQLRQQEGLLLQHAMHQAHSAHQQSLIAGFLGDWYDESGKQKDALRLTRKALFYAQQTGQHELLYRWQWQLGRLLLAKGKQDVAIVWLRRAVHTLTPIQPAMLRGFRSLESSFNRRIRAVYSTLADALLQKATNENNPINQQQLLQEARNTLELMKNAEVQNYFKSDCTTLAKEEQVQLDDVDPYTAILYPIIMPDRLSLLLSVAGKISQVPVAVTASKLSTTVLAFRKSLQTRSDNLFLYPAQQLYGWLIEPIQAELEKAHINTLVIVPDGGLRSIPFSALHDGQLFLIEHFAIAVTPSLQLTSPHPMDKQHINALVVGVSDAVQDFPPLPSVKNEIRDVAQIFQSSSLSNKDFTEKNIAQALEEQSFTLLHLATHGVFGGTPEESFLLSYDQKINMNQLQTLIGISKHHRKPLELLTMSACQTAIGNDQSSLGLAGVAIKAGARSALASLWYVDDEATALLIRYFYRALKQDGVSKAQALQQAQLRLIHQKYFWHPAYWAPFLLIGNWL